MLKNNLLLIWYILLMKDFNYFCNCSFNFLNLKEYRPKINIGTIDFYNIIFHI